MPPQNVTLLLAEVTKGNEEAEAKLLPVVYEELRRLARGYMRRERENHTLQPTALVHEAYLKMFERQAAVNWQNRTHFFGIAARVMRQILVDHARGHSREKRGGGEKKLQLEEEMAFAPERSLELLKIHEALQRLEKIDSRQARVVELRFFGGLSVEETAEVIRVSPKTVKREWSVAKAWLHGELRQTHVGGTKALGNR
ncbi:MAG TPA: sigma-70 family RNA polymerase sigma factor [Candidatus Sulfotelmatobacter sp.]|nr:sigma-70 family RNA polymerase sigma factor [Candidatus Sulfotelmatobacter sp.]